MPSNTNSPVGRAVQAELGLDRARRAALHLLRLDNEGGHALVALGLVRIGVEQPGIADMRLRDPHLVAVNFVVVALVDSVGLHAGDVGAGVGLGHGEKSELRAGDPAGDVFLLLLRRAEFGDGERRAEVLHVERHPPGGRDLADLLGHQHRLHEAHAAAAEFLRQRAGKEAELAHLGHAIGPELMLTLLLLECRRDLLGGEPLGRVLDQSLLFIQLEIHSCPVSRHRNRRILDDRFFSWSLRLFILSGRPSDVNRPAPMPALRYITKPAFGGLA